VGDNKEQLYEVSAYACVPDRFMQRIFAFCGGGSNGKGTFMKFLEKFIGKENIVSSEIKALSENQFEPAVLYGRLLCVMGEVSYDDLKNTNMIKKIAGEDLISFQFKNKMPFTEENTALCITLTNSLPTTPDKSLGFYRKWIIIDFPNQFAGIEYNPINNIPEIEFSNFALKCLNILKRLYQTKKFTNEGNFEERILRYEERSNPVLKFVEEFCEEEAGKYIPIREFTNRCNEFLKLKHLRILSAVQIGKILRNEGFLFGNMREGEFSVVSIKNLTFRNIKNINNIVNQSQITHKETNTTLGIIDILNIPKLQKTFNIINKKASNPTEDDPNIDFDELSEELKDE
jgi:P4 family phage/plasmid primase-like protien